MTRWLLGILDNFIKHYEKNFFDMDDEIDIEYPELLRRPTNDPLVVRNPR